MTPRARNQRFPLMDGARALAALAVFGYHVGYESGTNAYSRPLGLFTGYLDVGVAAFFAISGFLLYRQFLVARRSGRSRRLGAYGRARVLRIVPGYWVALTLASIYPTLVGPFTHRWWLFYGFLQDYSPTDSIHGLPQAWSLSVEMAFYCALPLFAFAMARISRGERWLLIELAALWSLAIGGAMLQLHIALYTIIGTFAWFAVGMSLAALSVWAAEGRQLPTALASLANRPTYCWAIAAATYIITCLIDPASLSRDASYLVKTAGYAVTAALVMIPVTLSPRVGGPARLLSTRPMAWLGTVSYGLFLYHLPVLIAIKRLGWETALGSQLVSYTVIGLAATCALAALSWYLVERPFLGLKSKRVDVPAATPEPLAAVPMAESAGSGKLTS
jgi:peptidoglycan/LPS O-acetylase OafA/YrhL